MFAVFYRDGVAKLEKVEAPKPGPGEVLIRVAAAGINRADVLQKEGAYPAPSGASDIPGLEVSGTIAALGAAVSLEQWPPGTEVCALLTGGGYAEYVSVPVGQLFPVPRGFSLAEAAAVPEVASTVVSNLRMTVDVQPGQWVLVHGGSGGIGTFALQYLRAVGAKIITTCSTVEKCQWVLRFGADYAINYVDQDFVALVEEITNGRGVDVVLDVVGAKYLDGNIRCLANGGRILVIGLQKGSRAELNLGTLLAKRAGIIGTTLRSRCKAEKTDIVRQTRREVWPLLETGQIRVPVDRTFPLAQVEEAQEYFNSGQHMGKVVLTLP